METDERVGEQLRRVEAGDPGAVGGLFELFRGRLTRMVAARLDPRLAARVAPEDVVQEVYLDVAARVGEHPRDRAVPAYVWARYLTLQRLAQVHRAQLGAAKRGAGRDGCPASSDSIAGRLAGDLTSPSRAAMRGELRERLRAALDGMDDLDREVIALRHFEEMTNQEAADVLGIHKDAASKRYVRALKRLKEVLEDPA